LSETVDLTILIPHIDELRKHHKHLELKLLRGTADDAADCRPRAKRAEAPSFPVGTGSKLS
jgi:hypothetical protein